MKGLSDVSYSIVEGKGMKEEINYTGGGELWVIDNCITYRYIHLFTTQSPIVIPN